MSECVCLWQLVVFLSLSLSLSLSRSLDILWLYLFLLYFSWRTRPRQGPSSWCRWTTPSLTAFTSRWWQPLRLCSPSSFVPLILSSLGPVDVPVCPGLTLTLYISACFFSGSQPKVLADADTAGEWFIFMCLQTHQTFPVTQNFRLISTPAGLQSFVQPNWGWKTAAEVWPGSGGSGGAEGNCCLFILWWDWAVSCCRPSLDRTWPHSSASPSCTPTRRGRESSSAVRPPASSTSPTRRRWRVTGPWGGTTRHVWPCWSALSTSERSSALYSIVMYSIVQFSIVQYSIL